jgi:hypothetical protein
MHELQSFYYYLISGQGILLEALPRRGHQREGGERGLGQIVDETFFSQKVLRTLSA